MNDFKTHPEEYVDDMTLIKSISIINKEISSGSVRDQTLNILKMVGGFSDEDFFNHLLKLKDTYSNILFKRHQN